MIHDHSTSQRNSESNSNLIKLIIFTGNRNLTIYPKDLKEFQYDVATHQRTNHTSSGKKRMGLREQYSLRSL
jgi:hypothetical protein